MQEEGRGQGFTVLYCKAVASCPARQIDVESALQGYSNQAPFTPILSSSAPLTTLLTTAVMSWEKRTNAIDHSHHLSDYARRYNPSYLKGLQKYYGKDLIPFAGGALIYPFPPWCF